MTQAAEPVAERTLAQVYAQLYPAEVAAELSKLNAELDSFAYSISHDLKSPLRAIDGFTQLLSERLESRLEPEEQQLMARVLGATHRMATLMADLLALARVNAQATNTGSPKSDGRSCVRPSTSGHLITATAST